MSTRRELPNQSPDREVGNTRLEQIGATVRRRALSGSEASTVGFTLVIYTFVGAGLGYWLDKHLETTYWIAIGMLLGTAIGFREMFRLTKKLTKSNALDNDDENVKLTSNSRFSNPSPHHSTRPEYSAAPQETASQETASQETAASKLPERKRIFSVPAPPQASFDTRQSTPEVRDELVNSTEDLIERLSQDNPVEDEGETQA